MALRHACGKPGCPAIIPGDQSFCERHRGEYDRRRGSAASRGYDHRWRREREAELLAEPLCRECLKAGVITPATVRDHIVPHKGNKALFHDPANRQSLCKHCHDAKTAREDGGFGR